MFGEILSVLFFVWLFGTCKFHYLPQMATHALGHMVYGYTLLVPMNIYNFTEEGRGLFLNFPADFLKFF